MVDGDQSRQQSVKNAPTFAFNRSPKCSSPANSGARYERQDARLDRASINDHLDHLAGNHLLSVVFLYNTPLLDLISQCLQSPNTLPGCAHRLRPTTPFAQPGDTILTALVSVLSFHETLESNVISWFQSRPNQYEVRAHRSAMTINQHI